ncbi:MAG: hypothetical protein V4858_24775 [Pseudomonadota bacterium]
MTSKMIIALAAGTGGVAPSAVHLAQGFVKANPDVPGLFYFLGVAIFFALGALVAFFFSETEAKKAFFLGIGLPALIATAQTQGGVPATPPTAWTNLFFPSAYAQASAPARPASADTPPKLQFKPSTDCKQCEIWFTDAEGAVVSKQVLGAPTVRPKTIAVPKGATQFGIADPKTNFKWVPIPAEPNAPVTIEFDRKYSPLNDLRRGLGNYDLKSYDQKIQLKKG